MSVKKSVFLCGAALTAVCLLGAPAQAQENPEGDRPRGRRDGEGRRGEGRRGQGRRGGRGFRAPNMEELGLSEEQKAKVEKLMEEVNAKRQAAMEERDFEAMRGLRTFIQEGFAKILTPEQMKKYEEAQASRRRGRGGQGRGGQGREGGFGRRGDPAARDKRLVDEVKKALVLSESEEGTLVPAIEKALAARREAQSATEKSRGAFLEALKTGLTGEELQARLAKFRSDRDAAEQKAKSASETLAAMVDTEQKAKLVAFGVLR